MGENTIAGKKVAIIGGGPGGLMLARLLQQAGIDVKVYERDANRHIRQQGSTLDMHHGTGLKAIEVAGLLDEFKKYYRKGADTSTLTDGHLRVYVDDKITTLRDFGDIDFRPEIDRGPLRDMLINSLRMENLVWNARFTNMTPQGQGWNIVFENGSSVYADLVIGADGANSRLRSYVTPVTAVYAGATAIEGNLLNAAVHAPRIWNLAKGGSLHALENGRTLFAITKGDGTLTFLMGVKTAENWLVASGIDLEDRCAVYAWFKEAFADWDPEWETLFTSEEVKFNARVWYYFPEDQYWQAHANITLLGDAAHRVPPYAGEGANQALADALELYEALCIAAHGDVHRAIAAYEKKMFARSSAITRLSVANTQGLHEKDNLEFLLKIYAGVGDKD